MRITHQDSVTRVIRGRTRLVGFQFFDENHDPQNLDGYVFTMTIGCLTAALPGEDYWLGESEDIETEFTGLTLTNRTQSGDDIGWLDWDPLDDGSGKTTKGTIEALIPGYYPIQFLYTTGGKEDRVPEQVGDAWLLVLPRLDAN